MSAPEPAVPASGGLARTPLLPAMGGLYAGLGVVLGAVWLLGGVEASLFPTGWLLPAVLVVSGALMAVRRRFDIVGVLWAGLVLAVFQLDLAVYLDAAALGVDDPAAFDATLITAFLGLVPLVLRPHFRA